MTDSVPNPSVRSHAPAYTANGAPVSAEHFYAIACDPARSVSVEACAGAGKTWMLVSRILRALLAGVKPEAILAITYTKKAAGEMRARLQEWLHAFAHEADDDVLVQELVNRGIAADQAKPLVPELRGLYARLIANPRSVEIRTFHGWFAQLLGAAPMGVLNELGLPASYELVEDDSELFAPAWYALLQKCLHNSELREDLENLLQEQGSFNTQEALRKAWERRIEFTLADAHGKVTDSVADAPDPGSQAMHAAFVQRWLGYAKVLGQEKNKTPQDAARAIEQALTAASAKQRLNMLREALFVKTEFRLNRNLQKFEAAQLAEQELQPLLEALIQHDAYVYQQRMMRLTRALLACYAQVKREQGKVDMVDLERVALRLLGDTETYGWVAQRLDASISQVLIDEFQDTNPLQWQALRSWFSAYGGIGGGGRLSVFIVGDPKQSIYRFRRADPAVFMAACDFLQQMWGADRLACDHTRRNAYGVIERVNELFTLAQTAGEYADFRAHTTAASQSGLVGILPPVEQTTRQEQSAQQRMQWRDSLTEPRYVEEEKLRKQEVRQVADLISQWIVQDGWRASDIKVLSRKKDRLRELLVELNHRRIPWRFADDVLLGQTQEIQDVTALLDVLASHMHDLSLAQVLRSPIFDVNDDDLMLLAQRVRQARMPVPDDAGCAAAEKTPVSWWDVLLQAAGEEDEFPAALQRAAGLLQQWEKLARELPPHDLLDAIYNQAALLARYAQAVPVAMRDEVLTNLRSLLQQALTLDGGRYATPYNFVRALRKRPIKSEYPGGGDAVELLTIHGAKGLEARGVIVLDTDPAKSRADGFSVLMDWPAQESHPRRFVFFTSAKKLPADVALLAQSEAAANAREELNALYVAMTRAQERLVFSAVKTGRDEQSWWSRLNQLQHIPELALAADVSSSQITAQGVFEQLEQSAYIPQLMEQPAQAAEWMELVRAETGLPGISRAAQLGAGNSAEQTSTAQRFGRVVHRLLEWGSTEDMHVQAAAREHGLDFGQAAKAARSAQAILTHAQSRRFFDADAIELAENEVELSYQGEIVRIDRLVMLDGQWWIVDYKSSWNPEAHHGDAYREQLALYRQALAQVYPETPIRTVLIAGNGEVTEY